MGLAGASIGPYVLEELLGEGSMGAVHRARKRGEEVDFALKVIHLPLPGHEEARARLRREIEILARLDHPGIVRFHEVVYEGPVTAIAMELVPGGSMTRLLASASRTLPQLFSLASGVLDALEHAWSSHGIVHRDVKPSNILVTPQDTVKLVDFGLARSMAEGLGASTVTVSGTILGTPHYMAPEQAMGKRVDFRADLYSLGVILYQMVTGRLPFTGASPLEVILKHRDEEVGFSASEERRLDPGVRARLACFLSKQPEDRPWDFDHARRLLVECLQLLENRPAPAFAVDRTLPAVTTASERGGSSDTRVMGPTPAPRARFLDRLRSIAMAGSLAGLAVLLPRMTMSPAQALSLAPASTPCPGTPATTPATAPGTEYTCADDFPGVAAGMTPGVCTHDRDLQLKSLKEGEPPVQNSHRSFRDLFAEAEARLVEGDRSPRTERLVRKVESELDARISGLDTHGRIFPLDARGRAAIGALQKDCAEAKRRLRASPAGTLAWLTGRWRDTNVTEHDAYLLESVFLLGDLQVPVGAIRPGHGPHSGMH